VNPLEFLARARAQFERRLAAVPAADLERPTPCPDWNVGQLIEHVIRGDVMACALLRGASRDEALAAQAPPGFDRDAQRAFAAAADEVAALFAEPGAMEPTVHHPIGDVPASMLLGFRAGDYTYHAWDLARATDQDETMDADVVAALLSVALASADRLKASGRFGGGASGSVGEDAPAQARLLDIVGRRP
jgi:uncharacterized protein (TIGR03086 family)